MCANFGNSPLRKGKFLEEQLFLEVLGSRRNYHPLAPANNGDQVGQGLPSTGAGLDDQAAAVLDGRLDLFCHFQLGGAELILWMVTGQPTLGPEDAFGAGLSQVVSCLVIPLLGLSGKQNPSAQPPSFCSD